MESKDVSMYSIKTENIIQEGKEIFPTYAHLFQLSAPEAYQQFYTIDMWVKIKTVSVLSLYLEELTALSARIKNELYTIVSQPGVTIGGVDPLMVPIYKLQQDLLLFERKFYEYPLRTFVASVIEQWTFMDILGFVEKLRYDRIFRYDAALSLPTYINELIRVFKTKFGDDLYQKIDIFRGEYLQLLSGKVCSCDVMDATTYASFMAILACADKRQLFDMPLSTLIPELKKIALDSLPDTHESK